MTHAELLRKHATDATNEGGMWFSGEYLSRIAETAESLEDENAKLRELVRILAYCMSEDRDCDRCALNGADMPTPRISACDSLPDLMRELGVEVDE